MKVWCTLAQVPALIRKQPRISCSNLVVTRSTIPVRNGKFILTREVPSIASPKSHVIEEDSNYDSLTSFSSEEPEILVPNSASEKDDVIFGKEVADLFQTPSYKQSP